jgi:hypothetical protein
MSVGGRRDLTGTRRFLCRLQQTRQLGDIAGNPPRLVGGQALSPCDGNLGAVSPQKEPQAETLRAWG